jgi:hypothetical protein
MLLKNYRKGYYFEKTSENCVIALQKYWMTVNGNYFITINLAKPGKANNVAARMLEKEILKIKLK